MIKERHFFKLPSPQFEVAFHAPRSGGDAITWHLGYAPDVPPMHRYDDAEYPTVSEAVLDWCDENGYDHPWFSGGIDADPVSEYRLVFTTLAAATHFKLRWC